MGTDKFQLGYMPTYYAIFAQLPAMPVICEIGVQSGYSLTLWQALLPDATVIGVDNNTEAHWPEGTVVIVADQANPELPIAIRNMSGHHYVDLIIDDASHHGKATLQTFVNLWPMVADGGFYVIEDYQVGWSGEVRGFHDPTMRDMARDLVDYAICGTAVESIAYRYGQIIIRKKP